MFCVTERKKKKDETKENKSWIASVSSRNKCATLNNRNTAISNYGVITKFYMSIRILIIFELVLPSPNGLIHVFVWVMLIFAASRILVGSVPARLFESSSRVSGLSVLSLKVMQGTLGRNRSRPRALYKSTKSQPQPAQPSASS